MPWLFSACFHALDIASENAASAPMTMAVMDNARQSSMTVKARREARMIDSSFVIRNRFVALVSGFLIQSPRHRNLGNLLGQLHSCPLLGSHGDCNNGKFPACNGRAENGRWVGNAHRPAILAAGQVG